MRILLLEDVDKLGYLGDVVDVKDGYARNYLIPYGFATIPTEGAVKSIAEEKEKRAQQRLEERKRMEQAAENVEGAEAVISAKANEQGHLFGSVTEKMIADNLRKQGFQVADEIVQLPSHIKEVGEHEVALKFAQDITANVKVTVVSSEAEEVIKEAQAEEQSEEKEESESEEGSSSEVEASGEEE